MTLRLRAGDAAEIAAKAEFQRAGFAVHRVLPTVRIIQGRYVASGNDLFTLFDLVALRADLTIWAQVKTRRADRAPSPDWLAKLAALPEPPATWFLWLWLDGFGRWSVTRCWPDGRTAPGDWPPANGRAA